MNYVNYVCDQHWCGLSTGYLGKAILVYNSTAKKIHGDIFKLLKGLFLGIKFEQTRFKCISTMNAIIF